jgi:hypothetical protein
VGKKKCTDHVGAFLKAEKYSLGFEVTARCFALSLGALNPSLSCTGVLTSTAAGCSCAGAGAFTRIDVKALAGFFGSGSTHWRNGEHCSCSCSKGDSGGFLSCNHKIILTFKLLVVLVLFPITRV